MNDCTLTQLKILVERVVRPVRASSERKRKMRDELLAHVSAVFEQEAKLRPHLELCDVVTLWSWNAVQLMDLEQNFARFEKIVGDKRKVLGIYLWDYGAKQPMPLTAMKHQCSLGLRWLQDGRIDGMIFLASCICDLGLEAVDWVRRWIATHGQSCLR